MFSTFENVETYLRNVENKRKNACFQWKTTEMIVENRRKEKQYCSQDLQSLLFPWFLRFQDKKDGKGLHMENMWIKIFFMWENMWKVLQIA